MRCEDVNKIYKNAKPVKKVNLSQIKMRKTIEYVYDLILDHADINVKMLLEVSGKCSYIINRCLNALVKDGRVKKTKVSLTGKPYMITLSVIIKSTVNDNKNKKLQSNY